MARKFFDIVVQYYYLKLLDYYANNYYTNVVHACFSVSFKFNKTYIQLAKKSDISECCIS